MHPSAAHRPRDEAWPALPLASWQDTYQALHLRAQIVGKTRLALAPMENHWWQVVLYVTPRGLSTSAIDDGHRTFEVEFDFLDHVVAIRTSDGDRRSLPLRAESVASFYESYTGALRELGIAARIWPVPVEMAEAVPFPEHRETAPYDGEAARRCWRALAEATRLLRIFRSRFLGKCSPVHFWWGAFDLACTRFSGAPAPPHPGGIPHLADRVTREAYSHACISAGWWPGTPGGFAEPAFYAYVYPEPPGCATAPVRPAAARYDPTLREWLLPYEAVRAAADPDAAVLDFLQSTYEAAAELAGWDRAALERAPAAARPATGPAAAPRGGGEVGDADDGAEERDPSEARMDEALSESFPASDPPFWALGR